MILRRVVKAEGVLQIVAKGLGDEKMKAGNMEPYFKKLGIK